MYRAETNRRNVSSFFLFGTVHWCVYVENISDTHRIATQRPAASKQASSPPSPPPYLSLPYTVARMSALSVAFAATGRHMLHKRAMLQRVCGHVSEACGHHGQVVSCRQYSAMPGHRAVRQVGLYQGSSHARLPGGGSSTYAVLKPRSVQPALRLGSSLHALWPLTPFSVRTAASHAHPWGASAGRRSAWNTCGAPLARGMVSSAAAHTTRQLAQAQHIHTRSLLTSVSLNCTLRMSRVRPGLMTCPLSLGRGLPRRLCHMPRLVRPVPWARRTVPCAGEGWRALGASGILGMSARRGVMQSEAEYLKRRQQANANTMYYLMAIGALVLGMAYAAVPLYRLFCQVRLVVLVP